MFRVGGGILLGWTLGANDAANVFGTGVASGAVRFRLAVLLTAFFALLGAVLEGTGPMETLNQVSTIKPDLAFVATMAAGITMLVLTLAALPASASQSIVGALLGVGIWNASANYQPLIKIGICWIATPVGGGILGYVLYRVLGALANRYIEGLSSFERFIRLGIIVSGCYGAYSLGANNVANATGPFVGAGLISPLTALLIGGASIGLGAITFSKPVMETVGGRITALGPLGAFIAILAMGITVHIFTQIGVPVSTSQAIVGAVAGIGMVRGSGGVSKGMLLRIVGGWLSTPVLAGLLAFNACGLAADLGWPLTG